MLRISLLLMFAATPCFAQDGFIDSGVPTGDEIRSTDDSLRIDTRIGPVTAGLPIPTTQCLDSQGELVTDGHYWPYPSRPMTIAINGVGELKGTPVPKAVVLNSSAEMEPSRLPLVVPVSRPVFVSSNSGYALKAVQDERDGKVRIEPWCRSAGRVTLNGEPVESGFVQAWWESVPFHPILTSHKDVAQAPPMVRLIRRVPIQNGEFEFTQLPTGRVQFTVFPDVESDSLPSSLNSSPFVWWETLEEKELITEGDLPSHDFAAVRVTGQIELTEELQRHRIHIRRNDGQVKVDESDMRLTFEDVNSHTGFNDKQMPDLDEALREAIIWGRAGGQREVGLPFGSVVVDATGKFEALLPRANYDVRLVIQDVTVDVETGKESGDSFRTLGSVAKVEEGDLSEEPFDLGLINVDQNLRSDAVFPFSSASEFPSPVDAEWNPRDSDGGRRNPLPQDRRGPSQTPFERVLGQQPSFADPFDRDADISWDSSDSRSPFGGRPFRAAPAIAANPPTSIDRSIADLVAKLLSANDRRVRADLEPTLHKLLEQKFDAEQQAREDIVKELEGRVQQARSQIDQRKTDRTRIVNEQLQRMMGLPEDNFPVPGQPLKPGDPTE